MPIDAGISVDVPGGNSTFRAFRDWAKYYYRRKRDTIAGTAQILPPQTYL